MEETVVIQQISQKGHKPEDWLEFITKVQQQAGSDSLDNYSHLVSLYKKAADNISPEDNVSSPAYAKILVDLAKLQAKTTNVDEARTTFQLARNNVKGFAVVYVSWAQFELDQGNRGKCRSLLRKGKQYGATPKHILQLAFANCVENKDRLLDEETEELSFTGLLTQKQNVLAQSQTSEDTRCSENLSPELTQGSQSSTDESTTGSHFSFKPIGSSETTKTGGSVESTVVSFKLPSVLDGYRNPTTGRRTGSSSSSSGDDADTVPFSKAVPGKYLSMSTKKPTAQSTPDCKSGLSSLAGNMNLSIRRPNKTRRGLLGNKLSFGIPMRVEEEPGSEEVGKGALKDIEKSLGEEKQFELPVEEKQDCEINESSSTLKGKATLPSMNCNSSRVMVDPQRQVKEIYSIATEGNVNPARTNTMTADNNDQYRKFSSQELSCELVAEQQLPTQSSREQSATMKQFQMPSIHQRSTPSALCEHHIPFNTCGLCIQVFQQQTPFVGQQYAYNVPQHYHSGSYPSATGPPRYMYPPHSHSGTPMSAPPPTSAVTNKTIMVNGKQYLQLEAIGRGGSSRVYKCFDGKKVCAVKHVNLEDADKVVVDSYINEITLLKSLQGNENVIKLFDWELNQDANSILLVMECGSIDLAGFLRKNRQQINDNDLRTYWNQMLNTVHAIHTNGIIHSDLKPANFLFVEGKLKLIDFGIANAIQGDKTSIIRDSQMGTLNYMSPEALRDTSYGSHPSSMDNGRQKPCLKIGRASDVWSLGCILYLMVYGKTPFQHITNHIMKLQCILDQNHHIELPEIKSRHLMDTIKGCLRRDPRQRYTIPQLLKHPYIASGELPDEEQFFNCLMQFKSRMDVNSPRSIRALTKGLVKQLQTGEQIDLSEVLPVEKPSTELFNMPSKPPQYPSHTNRQPLVGIDVQLLQHAQSSLKSISASSSEKYMRAARDKDMDKENADLQFILKKQIEEKYRNAIPANTAESTFEQSWSTCSTLP